MRRLLNEHLTAGRLTPEEFGERAHQAAQARTREQLWPLFRDLPAPWPEFDTAASPAFTGGGATPAAQRLQSQSSGSTVINWKYAAVSVVVPCAALGAGMGLATAFVFPAVLLLAILTVGVLYVGLMTAESFIQRRRGRVSEG